MTNSNTPKDTKKNASPTSGATTNAPSGGATPTGGTSSMSGGSTQDKMKDSAQQMKAKAAETADEAKSAASREFNRTAEDVKAKAQGHVEGAKSSVAGQVEETADRVREAGDAFDSSSLVHAAADRLAENLSYAADAVRDTDLSSLQQDLTEFARRNPLVFFGGAAALGFLTARMLKASERAETAYEASRHPTPASTARYPETTAAAGTGSSYAGPRTTADRSAWGYS